MIRTTSALVLRTVPYQDHKLIVTFFTQDYGLVSSIVSLPKQSVKGKFNKSLFQPLCYVQISYTYKANTNLQQLKEARVIQLWVNLYSQPYHQLVLLFYAEVLQKTIKNDEVQQSLFDWLIERLQSTEQSNALQAFPLLFLLDLCNELGWAPYNNYSAMHCYFNPVEGSFVANPSAQSWLETDSYQLYQLLQSNPEILQNSTSRRHLLQLMVIYYSVHVPGFNKLNTLTVMESML